MVKRILGLLLAVGMIASAVMPAEAKKIERPFIACKQVEDLLKVLQFKDNEQALMIYVATVIASGKCIMLNEGDNVDIVENLPSIGFSIIESGGVRMYTAQAAFEKG